MQTENTKYKINVHFVEHQVFYTPLYLCDDIYLDPETKRNKKYNIEFKTNYPDPNDEGKASDFELVKALFSDIESHPEEIDIYVTGGPHISIYNHLNPVVRKGAVVYWTSIVDRIPVQLLMSKGAGPNNYTISDLIDHEGPVYVPPINTSMHYFLAQNYNGSEFYSKFFERQGIVEIEEVKNHFKNKGPRTTEFIPVGFDELNDFLKKNPNSIGLGFSSDSEVDYSRQFHPGIEIIPFTCIFTKRDIWDNLDKRRIIKELSEDIQFNISKLHRYGGKYYDKDSQKRNYQTQDLDKAIDTYYGKKVEGEEKNNFIERLRYLVRHRIFAENLNNDLVVRSNGDQYFFNKNVEDALYNWIKNGSVAIESEIAREEHETKLVELAQVELLKCISASTHAIKTTINTALSAPLNSLKISNKDYRIGLIAEAKETLLINAELINLVSKLSVGNVNEKSIEEALIDSKWFASKNIDIDLMTQIETKLKICQLDKVSFPFPISIDPKSKFENPPEFLKINNLYPTERFFDFILLTVIENLYKHAMTKNYKISFSVEYRAKKLVFCNKPKHTNYMPKQLTGNYLVIDSILRKLKLGKVKLELNNGLFYSTIVSD